MASHRQWSALLSAVGVAVVLGSPGVSLAQNTGTDIAPVIDVHVHAMDESFLGLGPMCPNTSAFKASDPSTKEAPFGWVGEECTPKLYPSAKGEYLKDVVAEMERLNVTAVVFGDPKSVQKWRDAAPRRVIPGTGFSEGLQPGARVAIEELRKAFTKDGFKVMGEIGLQYEGLSRATRRSKRTSRSRKSSMSRSPSTWGRVDPGVPTSPCRSSGARWGTRSCWKTSSRVTPSCASR